LAQSILILLLGEAQLIALHTLCVLCVPVIHMRFQDCQYYSGIFPEICWKFPVRIRSTEN